MEQDFSIIPVKTRKEEYLRRYSFFFEKFPVEKCVPFDLSPEQPVFPYKRKAPQILAAAGTKHRSQVIVLPIQKASQILVKANLRPKNFCLGLRLDFTTIWDTFCIGKTMTCDLCFVPAVLSVPGAWVVVNKS